MRAPWRAVACALTVVWLGLAAPRPAQARIVRPVLSGSVGFGFEVHPDANPQAENMMLAFGLGFLGDILRPELGILTAYGKLWGKGRQTFQYELRPMLRLGMPFLPLYGRLIFAGLSVFEDRRNIAYGGALGLNFNAGPIAIFGEFGPLPRRVSGQTHWVLEARAGVAYRF